MQMSDEEIASLSGPEIIELIGRLLEALQIELMIGQTNECFDNDYRSASGWGSPRFSSLSNHQHGHRVG